MISLSFVDTVRERRAIRGFLPEPVPRKLMHLVLEDAQRSPSNCNTQPWSTHILSGAKLKKLSQLLLESNEARDYSLDFTFDETAYPSPYNERRRAQGKLYYESLGVKRDDVGERHKALARNFTFFGAPHVALLFMPSVGDNVRVTGDIGMYGQTFLLSLTAHGLGGVPQTVIGFFAEPIREFLGISQDFKLLFAISFGYPDYQAQANLLNMDRVPIDQSVIFHESSPL